MRSRPRGGVITDIARILQVVADRAAAAATWRGLFGAVATGDATSEALNARITTLQVGDTFVDLLEPLGAGPAATFLRNFGEGLLGAGLATSAFDTLLGRLDRRNDEYAREGQSLILPAAVTGSTLLTVTPAHQHLPIGRLAHIHEVVIVTDDHETAAARFSDRFGLDTRTFEPIASERFQLHGTRARFEPEHADALTFAQPGAIDSAMARFLARRGTAPWLCTASTPDIAALTEHLDERNTRYEFIDAATPERGLFIHPSALHGLLFAVIPTA